MDDRVLVTGATGKVGAELVRLLRERGVEVKAGTRNPERARVALGDGVDVVELDYDMTETWDAAVQWAERVFLVAPPFDPRADERLVPFLDWTVQSGCRHLVLLSAMGTEDADRMAMRRVERRVRRTGVPWTFLRPNIYMQNFARGFLRQDIRDRGVLRLPAGAAAVSFVDARDVAAAAAVVLGGDDHFEQIHTLTGPRALDHAEAAAIIGAVAGRDVRYEPSAEQDLLELLHDLGWRDGQATTFAALLASIRAGERAATAPDLARLLGRDATSFEEFARDSVERWRQPD